ncbi:Domain of unknown function [Anaerosporobacter mobilis DSM 15930]|uniref:BppU N-terminal domain-containing protein n=2 Tax=Anaerosporobacter mobilis DSM 15930 TaxID=1120996 RepID=A0A1M7NK72_9FIRM|nr:BppU family phage baseplate upper protein [Anaerosporobacter mobilis]SHN04117.1 Domain of unknown function [Anaerosporobacter mobilis DSM 15930]
MRSYNIIVSPYQKNTVDTQFYFKQNDYGIPISITVEDYETSGTTAKIVFRLNDGAIREYNITQSGDGTYKYNLSADELCSVGKVIVDLKFYKNNARESTASFIIYVMRDKVGQIFDSADYSDSISRAIERCDQAVANIQAQANKAIEDVENALLAELNIYDGYDKTTVGFAADARQLNENVVNSFASKVKEKIDSNTNLINALNNNLLNKSKFNSANYSYVYLIGACRTSGKCECVFSFPLTYSTKPTVTVTRSLGFYDRTYGNVPVTIVVTEVGSVIFEVTHSSYIAGSLYSIGAWFSVDGTIV